MSAQTARMSGSGLIAPHGGELVNRTVAGDEAAALREEAEGLPRVHMSEKQTADLDMIASGALSPLTGFMVQADYDRVVSDMHLENGLPWALPVTLSVPEKPRPLLRCVRTTSPSRWSTRTPRRSISGPMIRAMVVLPEPDNPVNQRVKP